MPFEGGLQVIDIPTAPLPLSTFAKVLPKPYISIPNVMPRQIFLESSPFHACFVFFLRNRCDLLEAFTFDSLLLYFFYSIPSASAWGGGGEVRSLSLRAGSVASNFKATKFKPNSGHFLAG